MAIFRRGTNRGRKGSWSKNSDDTLTGYHKSPPTALRIFTALSYLISIIFIILVEIGSINNDAVIRDTYFLKINLANVIPSSVPNYNFINSIAQSIGLHDFYQVGLWNFCEGYNGQGITYCSPTKSLYWFNPVEILTNELLAGASIVLPADLISTLGIVKIASEWMFACFLVGACLTFICIFVAPMGFSKKPRWEHKRKRIFLRQLPITLVTFGAFLFTGGATVIATVMFIIFRNTFRGVAELNIVAHLGSEMFAFMWVAVGFNLIGLLIQLGTCCGVCCCNGRKKYERSKANATGMTTDGTPASSPAGNEKVAVDAGGRQRGLFGFRNRRNKETAA